MGKLAVALIIGVLLPAGARSKEPAAGEALLERAAADKESGRFEAAAREFEGALRARPGDYWLRVQLAQCYVGLGRPDSARKEFAAAKRIDPRQAEAYIQEGYMDLAAGRGRRAERDLRQLVAVDTANPAGYHHLGSILSFEGRPAEAEPYFRKALTLLDAAPRADPGDRLHALAWLGDLALQRGRLDEAGAYYETGLRAAPPRGDFSVKFLMSLGSVEKARRRTAAAGDFFRRAADVCRDPAACPSYAPQAFIELARFESENGRPREARDDADRAWGLLADRTLPSLMDGHCHVLLDLLGDLYWKLGDWRGAVKSYGRLLPLRSIAPSSPELAWAEYGLAGVYAAQGRRPEAARLYGRAAEIWLRDGELARGREARERASSVVKRESPRRAHDQP